MEVRFDFIPFHSIHYILFYSILSYYILHHNILPIIPAALLNHKVSSFQGILEREQEHSVVYGSIDFIPFHSIHYILFYSILSYYILHHNILPIIPAALLNHKVSSFQGILEREQEHSVVYGSIDFGKTVVTCDSYKNLLEKTTKSLRIQSHRYV